MPTAAVKAFDGLKPLVDPVLLPQGSSTVASNVKLVSGAIQPLRGTTTLKALTKTAPQTIFRYGTSSNENEYWLEFLAKTDVMRSPIVDNQYGMLYWADGTDVRYAPNNLILSGSSYPGASYKLGIPAPLGRPLISGSTAAVASQAVTLTARYTYVSTFGEEGPPSEVSLLVSVDPNQNITVSGMSGAPTGAYSIATKRIYVSSTVGNAAQFQFWKEVPVATSSTSGAYDQATLGEVIPSVDWVAPPANLRGLKMMANNVAIGFVENTLYLSEPNLPHAWPNQVPVDHRIIGVGTFGQTAVVLTDAFPYLVTAVDPAAASSEKLSLAQACVSFDSVVDIGNGVIYASPDGLVQISSAGIDLITKSLFTKEQWTAYNPSSIRATIHENRYIAFYTRVDGTRGTLIFDFSGQGAMLLSSDLNTATAVTAYYHDPRSDTLYLAQGTNIVRYDAGNALTSTWRSKTFRLPFQINMAVGQVIASAYPVTMKIYADGVLKQTKTVTSQDIFRLTGGFRARDWAFELSGSSTITEASISTSVEELRAV